MLNLALGRTYLAAIDPTLTRRTWQTVIDEFCARGRESTQARNRRATSSKNFDPLLTKKLIETSAEDLRQALKGMGAFNHHMLRCLHNLALGLGWIAWAILPPKLWPKVRPKPKRAITRAEHQEIVAAEQNPERRLYYELLWELGGAQTGVFPKNEEWIRATLEKILKGSSKNTSTQ